MKAAIYLRISQDATGETLGVSRQLEDCTELAAKQGWDVVEIYTDNDISASSGKARPAYKKMLADVELGLVEAIVTWSPDRLYRKLSDLETLIPTIETHNVAIRAVKAGDIDLTTAYGRMIARILGAVTTGEGEIKSERWRRSWRQGREAGKPAKTGSRMFGYTREGELIPEEAAIARQMADDLLSGVTLNDIGRRLDIEGVRTTRNSIWRTSTITQYLSNPRIAGWSTLKGEIVAPGNWEPIIDRETWESVRALLGARTKETPYRKAVLGGLIHCAICGERMLTSASRNKRTYRCASRPGWQGGRSCGRVSVAAEPVEQIVEDYAKGILRDPEVRARIAGMRSESPLTQVEVANLELRIHELEQQLDEPGVPVPTILRAIERAKARQGELLQSLATIPRVEVPASPAGWPEDLRRRRSLVDLVVARVTITQAPPGNRFNEERVQIEPR